MSLLREQHLSLPRCPEHFLRTVMTTTRRQLNEPVITVATGTLIYQKDGNFNDRLALEVTNITSTTASFDLLMGGENICVSTKVDPNSPPYLVTDQLVCFSSITANSTPSSAVVFTGYAQRDTR